jgi:hypothetical protein
LTNNYVTWLTDYTRNLTENENYIEENKKRMENFDIEKDEEELIDITLPWKNVNKLKHVKLENGDIMLVYEIWNQTDYHYTAYQVLDEYAAPMVKETKICYPIRLHRTESLLLDTDGKSVLILESNGDSINMFTISPSYDPYARYDEDGALRRYIAIALSIISGILIFI